MNDAELFNLWGPPCSGPSVRVPLFGDGKVVVHPVIVPAVYALSAVYEEFGYRTRAGDTGAYVCRDKVGQPGHKSIHALKLAIDTNWTTNPFGKTLVTDRPDAMNKAIAAIRTEDGAPVWDWGGYWRGNKDAMHNQIACGPKNLAHGIDMRTVGKTGPPPATPDPGHDLRTAIFYAKQTVLGPGRENPPAAVSLLQVGLNHLTGRGLAITGQWDAPTAQCVIDVQRITGRNELGLCGRQTWDTVFP